MPSVCVIELLCVSEEEARLRDELESMSVKLDEARKSAGDATYKANLDKMLTLQQETEVTHTHKRERQGETWCCAV